MLFTMFYLHYFQYDAIKDHVSSHLEKKEKEKKKGILLRRVKV